MLHGYKQVPKLKCNLEDVKPDAARLEIFWGGENLSFCNKYDQPNSTYPVFPMTSPPVGKSGPGMYSNNSCNYCKKNECET